MGITVTTEPQPEHSGHNDHPDNTGRPSADPAPRHLGFSRRRLIASAAVAGGTGAIGAFAGFGAGRSGAADRAEAMPSRDLRGANGPVTEPFYAPHQSGVETTPQAHAHFLALTLKPGSKAGDVMRWLRLLTADAAALTQGSGPLADSEPELAHDPARLTITFGFGRGLVKLAGEESVPKWLGPLEKFPIDDLDPDRCTGDLLLQICGDDPLTLAHARRMLWKDSRNFAEVAWQRDGFRRSYGSQGEAKTQRNLFGQLDGTANPGPGSEDFARIVWGQGTGRADAVHSARGAPPDDLGAHLPDWMRGGTTLVLRDIAMNLDTWDKADRPAREFATGRTLGSGAPLSGVDEFDVPDFDAVDKRGLTKISAAAHVARARDGLNPEMQIHRRTFNYETGAGEGAGLLFASFQADIARQFLPIQRRLAEVDLLNEWTTPIGSTVWAIPPGVKEGEYIGQSLFEG
ncbi:MAG TPA: Dyp-type peroxidase [Brevibacterium sp.]|uniref:Dye decolorizing peroxidase n=3 Tax=Brevibacteriaceae TaxID=85019 RepID=A0A2H1KKP7_9MICO|nr:dye decolorizing peroxidase [Brevibacterium antiquum]SMY00134.1 dye decolorizing peroxidase [Brevibacterium antiquum CNRZ 918]HCG55962.1 Dyp-type peroxidase [Brevibacterium sp.]